MPRSLVAVVRHIYICVCVFRFIDIGDSLLLNTTLFTCPHWCNLDETMPVFSLAGQGSKLSGVGGRNAP